MRILVCGSRRWKDYKAVKETLDLELDSLNPNDTLTIIEGGARGADRLAGQWAEEMAEVGVRHLKFTADWTRYGKSAGPRRNTQMLIEGRPDLVIAFWDGSSLGTLNMMDQARASRVEVRVYPDGMVAGR